MDYRVGSVADLISGSNTPNKPQAVKRKIKQLSISTKESTKELPKKLGKAEQNFKNNTSKEKLSVEGNEKHYFNSKLLTNSNRKANLKSKKGKQLLTQIVDESLNESDITVIDHTLLNSKAADVDNKKRSDVEDNEISDKSDNETSDEGSDLEDSSSHNRTISNTKEINGRTVFVGNVPVMIKKRQLQRLFFKVGNVQSVRLRCIAPAEPGISKRVAAIKKLMHPKRLTMHSYIKFEKREDALKAVEMNGIKFQNHHLRIQICDDSQKPDPSKAIFLGNVPFDIEDEELWTTFESCGPIHSVRIIRDSKTNMGIGIAYINFMSSDSVELALQMGSVNIKNRSVHIKCYTVKKKNQKLGAKSREHPYKNKDLINKMHKRPKGYGNNFETSSEQGTNKSEKIKTFPQSSVNVAVSKSIFQGMKSSQKKKKLQVNKGFMQKMKLKEKIAPK